MNVNRFLEELKKTYILNFNIEHQQGYYYKIHCSYNDLDFYISYKYDTNIPEIQNLYFISKEIETEILKYFYKE